MEFLRTILKSFVENVQITKRGFFSTFFKTEAEDYVDTDTVEIDIERAGNKVAPAVKDLKTGAIVISAENFDTKEFRPPIIPLKYPVNIYDLMKRRPGENDFSAIGSWRGRLFNTIKPQFIRMHKMIKENVELQASQILQTGTITLQDENGNDAYTLAYPVNPNHFPTVGTDWGTAGATPLDDIEALCQEINDDGNVDPSIAIFGKTAWQNFTADATVQSMIKKDGLNLGGMNPGMKNRGGRYMGYIDIGTFRLELWTYNDSYETVNSNTKKRYMDPNKVIITADLADLDFRTVYAGVPSLGMDAEFASIIPSVVTYDGFLRIHNRMFKDDNNDTYIAESKARPLSIPVSIDRFGCLTTKQ